MFFGVAPSTGLNVSNVVDDAAFSITPQLWECGGKFYAVRFMVELLGFLVL